MKQKKSIYQIVQQYNLSLVEIHDAAYSLNIEIDDALSPSQLERILKKISKGEKRQVKPNRSFPQAEEKEEKAQQALEAREPRARAEESVGKRRRHSAMYKRRMMLEYGKSIPHPITGLEWDTMEYYFRQVHPNSFIPRSKEIIRFFGSWYAFWNALGKEYDPDNPTDTPVRDHVRGLLEMELEHKDIARYLHLSMRAVRQYHKDIGILGKEYVKKNIQSLDDLVNKPLFGAKHWSGKEKEGAGKKILTATVDALAESMDVSYLGMPAANFIDYIRTARDLGINAGKSLVAEDDPNIANFISSILKYRSEIGGGEVFEGLTFHDGPVLQALRAYPNHRFNFAFLDYTGGWCLEREKTLVELVRNHLLDEAVVFITCKNDTLEKKRLLRGRGMTAPSFGTDNQYVIAKGFLEKLSTSYGYTLEEVFPEHFIRYEDEWPMMVLGFKLKKEQVKEAVEKTTLEELMGERHRSQRLIVELHHDSSKNEHYLRLYRVHPSSDREKRLKSLTVKSGQRPENGMSLYDETANVVMQLRKQGYEISLRRTHGFKEYLRKVKRK